MPFYAVACYLVYDEGKSFELSTEGVMDFIYADSDEDAKNLLAGRRISNLLGQKPKATLKLKMTLAREITPYQVT